MHSQNNPWLGNRECLLFFFFLSLFWTLDWNWDFDSFLEVWDGGIWLVSGGEGSWDGMGNLRPQPNPAAEPSLPQPIVIAHPHRDGCVCLFVCRKGRV